MELRSKCENKKFCYVQILNIAKTKKWLVIGLVLLSGLAYAGWESWTQLTAPADGDILAVQDISDTTQDATGTAKYLTLTTFWTEYLKGKADALYQPIFQSQTANYAFIAPNGSAGVPTFRALVVADISDLLSGNHTFAGNLTFNGTTTIGVPVWPDTATLPDEVGELRYVNNALGFTDGAFGWYDDDEARYFLDTAMVDNTAGGTDSLTNRPPSSNALYDVAQAKLSISAIDDTPVDSETSAPISSNWAYDHSFIDKGFTIVDSTTSIEVADGLQYWVVPAYMNGMKLVAATASVADLNSAASGATTVVVRRVRGNTAVDMTSTGITVGYNEYTASDAVIDTSGTPANDTLATGDKIFVDVNAITSPAHKGLSATLVFQ